MFVARQAIAAYYAELGSTVTANDLILHHQHQRRLFVSYFGCCATRETQCWCLHQVIRSSIFLADLQDVKLVPYELLYDHGWQIDFQSVLTAIRHAAREGSRCRAVLVVHPNNPTGSFVKPNEAQQLHKICVAEDMAIIADEVFVYSLGLGVPFIVAAFAIEPFAAFLSRFRNYLHRIEQVMGGLLVLTGVAFLTGSINQMSVWLLETFPVLGKIG